MDPNITTVVIYHGGCSDGTAAAWAISLALDNTKTFYHYGKFKEPYPDVKGRDVIFVDFTYELESTLKMLQQAKSVLILDHHKTAKNLEFITDPRLTLKLDMSRSGAQLAWDEAMERLDSKLLPDNFVPAQFGTVPAGVANADAVRYVNEFIQVRHTMGIERPWFIDDIADRDLWKYVRPESKETCRRMHSMGSSERINLFYELFALQRDELSEQGAILLVDDERIYQQIVKNATDCIMTSPDGTKTWKVRVVTCDSSQGSEVGNRLVLDKLCDFALMYRYNLPKKEWWCQCRALDGTDVDLTQIIPIFDPKGGGHAKAAGMTLYGVDTLNKFIVPVGEKFITTAQKAKEATDKDTNEANQSPQK